MEDNQVRIEYDKLDCLEDYRVTYNGELFTGIAFEEDHEGRLLSEVTFVDGLEEGISRDYSPSGQLQLEENLHRGGFKGWWRRWYENGQLEVERLYDEHHTLIKERIWKRNGGLIKDWSG